MLPRVAPVLRSLSGVLRQQQSRVVVPAAGYSAVFKPEHEVAKETKATINDLPVPAGSWQEGYSKKSSRQNIFLALSTLSLVVTYFAMKVGGVFSVHTLPNYKKVPIDPTKAME